MLVLTCFHSQRENYGDVLLEASGTLDVVFPTGSAGTGGVVVVSFLLQIVGENGQSCLVMLSEHFVGNAMFSCNFANAWLN